MDYKKLNDLLVKTGKGDNQAFAEFYQLTIKGVFVFAYSYIKEKTVAEDIAQDTYIQVKQKAYTYKSGTNASAWLLQITKNLAIDTLRKRSRTDKYVAEERDFERAVYSPFEEGSALEYMFSKLSDEQKEIVILHVFWGYKHKEIAKQLQIPLGTVLWKYNEAIKTLKKYGEKL